MKFIAVAIVATENVTAVKEPYKSPIDALPLRWTGPNDAAIH